MPSNIRAAACLCLAALLCLLTAPASAQSPRVTVRLTSGGQITGTVAVDIPGEPLVIESAGEVYRIPRADIASVLNAGDQPTPTAPVGPPVSRYPASTEATRSGPTSQLASITLNADVRGYALIDPSWDPRIVALVHDRNRATQQMRSKVTFGVVLMGVGLLAIIAGPVTHNALIRSCADEDMYDYPDCISGAREIGIILPVLGAVMHGVGIALLVRTIIRRIRGKTLRRRIDQDLLQLDVVPSPQLAGAQFSVTGRF